jgi:hypothetical protein
MKRITLFYLENCPFCKKAMAAIDELKKQDRYKDIEIEMIEESKQPEVADKYDYYYVPTFYIDGRKVHEGGIFPDEVKAVLEQALE